jgi:HK97 family phage prohead protease
MMMLRELSDRAGLTRENRAVSADFEVRADDDAPTVTFEGTASVVDTPYAVRDMFGEFEETIAKGAFRKTLGEKGDVRLLVNHDGVPLARTKSNTLKLSATPHLRAVADLDPSNPDVQRIQSAMSRGDLDQMSIGMRVHRQEWNDDYTERTIREAELFDVSVVTYPASPTTSASLRSVDDLLAELADVDLDEADLRRAIAALEARMPAPDPVEPVERGLMVTSELIELFARRLGAA